MCFVTLPPPALVMVVTAQLPPATTIRSMEPISANPSRRGQEPCPDCPATRRDVFDPMIPHEGSSCAFRCVAVPARDHLPDRWFGTYGLALVRRGVVVRQRIDASGVASAVDVAGPGSALLLGDIAGRFGTSTPAGYAATDTLLCLCPAPSLEHAIDSVEGASSDLIRLQAEAMARMECLADARARPTVQKKVAALLCVLADGLSPDRRRHRLPSALQQRDLAHILGVRHESVCRVLGVLERDGAVRRDTEGLYIVDRARLEHS